MPTIEAPRLASATPADLARVDPSVIAPALRAAVADRCQRKGRSCFAEAREAEQAGRIEAAADLAAWGKVWMRERRRWIGPGSDQATDQGSP